ncbi:GGDEF domain-containing protein [Bacillus sp. NP157]|nr:GGDEF domain-containing protein [Bacillus sp. NP157]
MSVTHRPLHRWLSVLAFLTLAYHAGDARAQLRPGEDAAATLATIDASKTSDHPGFVATLDRLGRVRDTLATDARAHFDYLVAWQVAYGGDYPRALPLLEDIADHSPGKVLRLRATATLINILGIGHRYQDAFIRLNGMVTALPGVTDHPARLQALLEAAQMLTTAGQYDLAADYADRGVAEAVTPAEACKANMVKLHAQYRGGRVDGNSPAFVQWVADCQKAGEVLVANALRADVAESAIARGDATAATALLERYYASVVRDQYPIQTAQFDALMARAAWAVGNVDGAERHAMAAIRNGVQGEFSETLVSATRTAYLVAKKRGDWRAATGWLERHMAADKGYLDDVTARALAYQVVKQELGASRLEADGLDKQNQILHLQREADLRDAQTNRLYFLMLLTLTATIVLWLLRTRRSQRRFMRQARHDSLTGISNRQYFVDQCTAALAEASRSREPIALALFDLDHFKQINDSFGHAEGDWVLLRVVAECRDHLAANDVFGRLGGEEFAVLFRATTPAQALERVERVRVAIGEPSTEHRTIARATASFGVACTGTFGYDLDRLLMKADEAMYAAKAAGRNRAIMATLRPAPAAASTP